MKFLLIGHGGFYNRGCEAIVRTTTALLRERFGDVQIILASHRLVDDRAHEAAQGLTVIRHWARRLTGSWFLANVAKRVLRDAALARRFSSAPLLRKAEEADVVLSIGGDNFTMGRSFPWVWVQLHEAIHTRRRPLVLWGASIGPFPAGDLENAAMATLRKAALITVRESITAQYLERNGVVGNVSLVADPAFLLPTKAVETSGFWPDGDGVLGLNVSPLLGGARGNDGDALVLSAASEVIRCALGLGLGVLLVSHVYGMKGDRAFMGQLLAAAGGDRRVRALPTGLDACQTKHVISQCRLLVAGRTHATIAGFSTGVPTLSLAYSQKALGLNQDIFGHQEWVVDTRSLTDVTEVAVAVRRMVEHEDELRGTILEAGKVMRRRARLGVEHLGAALAMPGVP